MLAEGNVSEPVMLTDTAVYYPERWLANGKAYEFTTKPTESPPAELIAKFERLVASVGVLGLYYAGDHENTLKLEWTEGRKNITRVLADTENLVGYTETAWNPSKENPVTMAFIILCDTLTLRDGLRRLKPPRGAGWEPRGSDGRQSSKLLVVAAPRAN